MVSFALFNIHRIVGEKILLFRFCFFTRFFLFPRAVKLSTCTFVWVVLTSAQLARQAQQERAQVVCSNKEAMKRLTESKGIPARTLDTLMLFCTGVFVSG